MSPPRMSTTTAPSSSLVQDTSLSRMRHGFESHRGHCRRRDGERRRRTSRHQAAIKPRPIQARAASQPSPSHVPQQSNVARGAASPASKPQVRSTTRVRPHPVKAISGASAFKWNSSVRRSGTAALCCEVVSAQLLPMAGRHDDFLGIDRRAATSRVLRSSEGPRPRRRERGIRQSVSSTQTMPRVASQHSLPARVSRVVPSFPLRPGARWLPVRAFAR